MPITMPKFKFYTRKKDPLQSYKHTTPEQVKTEARFLVWKKSEGGGQKILNGKRQKD